MEISDSDKLNSKALPILVHPHPNLRKVAQPVEEFNPELRQLALDLLHTMYEEGGIGLAATQVNVQLRILVIDLSGDWKEPQVFVNPVLNSTSGSQVLEEGCLSVPNFYDEVERPSHVQVSAYDVYGNQFEKEATGLEASCIQHEIDHLNGTLFVDYLSRLKQIRIRQKLRKARS
ncbi:MAG: peptide deformylase [Gammaproteobacteria bacterium]|nr:peptide deformylase [Gammaproteobacteria bacterium]